MRDVLIIAPEDGCLFWRSERCPFPRETSRETLEETPGLDLVSDSSLSQKIQSFFTMAEMYIESTPYKWPFNGNLTPQNTCIIVIVSERRSLVEQVTLTILVLSSRSMRRRPSNVFMVSLARRVSGYAS